MRNFKIVVPAPRVKNVSVPLENVAPLRGCSECADGCCEVPPEDILCRSDNHERYKDCSEYNSEFCRTECEYGPKEMPGDDVGIDHTREDGA